MRDKINAVIMCALIAILLSGCSKEPPKCSDDKTTALVRKIILDQIHGSEKLSEKEIQEIVKIEFPRASAFDEKIKKYSCQGKLISGGTYELPITYDSQLDDKGQHIVSVGGISQVDLYGVKSGLFRGYETAAKSDVINAYTSAQAFFSDSPSATVTLTDLSNYGFKTTQNVTTTVANGKQATLSISAVNTSGGRTLVIDPNGTITPIR